MRHDEIRRKLQSPEYHPSREDVAILLEELEVLASVNKNACDVINKLKSNAFQDGVCDLLRRLPDESRRDKLMLEVLDCKKVTPFDRVVEYSYEGQGEAIAFSNLPGEWWWIKC